MCMLAIQIVFFWLCVENRDAAREVPDCLAALQSGASKMGMQDPRECFEAVRGQTRAGDRVVWEQLRRLIVTDGIAIPIRIEALTVACEKADAEIATEILSLGATWAMALDMTERGTRGASLDETEGAKSALLSTLVLEGIKHLEKVVADQQPILRLLTRVVTRAICTLECKSECYRSIVENPAPRETKVPYAIEIIREERARTEPSQLLIGLVSDAEFPELRALVRESGDPDAFHFAAAAALAHLGDLEIIPDLEARRPAFRQEHVNIEGYLIYYLWQIDIQHSDQRLIDYIAAIPEPHDTRRTWAIRRAVERGIPKGQLREAVLRHATRVSPNQHGIRPGLTSLKAEAIELGILNPDDLPDVRIPPKPTP